MTYAPTPHEQLLADVDRERERAEYDQALEDRRRDYAPHGAAGPAHAGWPVAPTASPARAEAHAAPVLPRTAPGPVAADPGAKGGNPDPSDLGRQHGNRDVPRA